MTLSERFPVKWIDLLHETLSVIQRESGEWHRDDSNRSSGAAAVALLRVAAERLIAFMTAAHYSYGIPTFICVIGDADK
jgi:hypothetical protein